MESVGFAFDTDGAEAYVIAEIFDPKFWRGTKLGLGHSFRRDL